MQTFIIFIIEYRAELISRSNQNSQKMNVIRQNMKNSISEKKEKDCKIRIVLIHHYHHHHYFIVDVIVVIVIKH